MRTGSDIYGDYAGQSRTLFGLALKTSLLTVFTLGLYRFWAKTRVRKYIWSSVNGDGDSFEYTGTGLEKFLGFLAAIVMLAVYLGIVQMGLFYFGLTLFTEATTPEGQLTQALSLYITFLAVLPLWFFAQYRARRYKLSRTRWRGLRFGADQAAWGFALRAIWHRFLTGITLGILLPRQTFYLDKYMTDRSWYGDAKFEQTGRWTELYPAMKHLFISFGIIMGSVVISVVTQNFVLGGLLFFIGYIWGMVGFVSYRVRSFVCLMENKVLDDQIMFTSEVKTGVITKKIIVGAVLMALSLGIILAILGLLMQMFLGPVLTSPDVSDFKGASTALTGLVLYIVSLVLSGVYSLVLIIQPIIDHVVSTLSVHNADALDVIRQRMMDDGADAEGFADALDVGGAF